jgi:prevent-host-death family protein
MQVNMLDAKNQLSRLVKEALAGEDVVIASNGTPMVRLVPVAKKGRLRGYGALKVRASVIDDAFAPTVEEEVARQLRGRR